MFNCLLININKEYIGMRLLNTTTYVLEEFFEKDIPPYAILSHRWEAEEVIYRDLDSSRSHRHIPYEKRGWSKISGCCKQALEDKYAWVWIDSCCIDKASSAELSEAINSMFSWYQKAGTCYAYLSDVGRQDAKQYTKNPELANKEFRESKWFTRGWTLQELLAPESLMFFDYAWKVIGSKKNLTELVRLASGIEDLQNFELASIAQKFSWAAKRETTRVEDRAYSLLGLFGINMPPIYGEGEKAFLRLQLEIIKVTNDETIFAWENNGSRPTGLLAQSPDAFKLSGNVRSFDYEFSRPSFGMTNQGLRFESLLLAGPVCQEEFDNERNLFPLQCLIHEAGGDSRLAVYLRHIDGSVYARVDSAELVRLNKSQERSMTVMIQEKRTKQVFHVSQFGPALTFWGPYTFTTKLSTDLRRRFKFTAERRDIYVQRPIRARWQRLKSSGEARLKTSDLPIPGTGAAVRFREIDMEANGSKSKKERDTFFIRLSIWNHQVYCEIFSGDSDEHDLALEDVIESGGGAFNRSGSTADLASGSFIKVGLRRVDDTGLNYEIDIEAGSKEKQ